MIRHRLVNSSLIRGKGHLKRDTRYEIRNTRYDRFVFLFAVWWLLDMGFVWVSPHSYEQYFLPLNASGAMLGGYLIAAYTSLLDKPVNKNLWRAAGLVG